MQGLTKMVGEPTTWRYFSRFSTVRQLAITIFKMKVDSPKIGPSLKRKIIQRQLTQQFISDIHHVVT